MSGDLTHTRVTLPGGAGEPPRVEVAARPGLAREVLIDRALPLLRRARRIADTLAGAPRFTGAAWDGYALISAQEVASVERLADDIAALVGHAVTDQEPAPELDAVLREGEPARLTPAMLRQFPGLSGEEYAHLRYGRPMSGDPLTRKEAEEWAGPTTATCAACGGLIETDRSDFFVRGRWRHVGARTWDHAAVPETPADREARCAVIPLCPMAPYAESSEPATRVVTCTCGARPGQGHQLRCAVLA